MVESESSYEPIVRHYASITRKQDLQVGPVINPHVRHRVDGRDRREDANTRSGDKICILSMQIDKLM